MTNVKSITRQVRKKKYFSFIKVNLVQLRVCIDAWEITLKPLNATLGHSDPRSSKNGSMHLGKVLRNWVAS